MYVLQEPLFGMLTAPLENSLIRMDDEQKQEAVNTFSLVHVAYHAAGKLTRHGAH